MFASKAEAYLKKAPFRCSTLGWACLGQTLYLIIKIYKISVKKFFNIEPKTGIYSGNYFSLSLKLWQKNEC
jgi:hypothetical protein